LTSLPDPVKTGHTFVGWFTEVLGGERVTTNTVFYDHADIHAHLIFNGLHFTITLNLNCGGCTVDEKIPSSVGSGEGGKLEDFDEWETPTRDGTHIFKGWFTSPTGGEMITANTVFSASSVIFARWGLAARTITFNVNGGNPLTTTSGTTGDDGRLA